MSTPWTYGVVNGVNFRVIAECFALSLLRQSFSVAMNLRHFSSLTVVLNRVDSVHFGNPLTFATKNVMSR